MNKSKKIVLFGTGDLAAIAHEYFTRDSAYEVVAFTVDREYMRGSEFCGLPIVPFDEIIERFPPEAHEVHVCLVYNRMNRCRQDVCSRAKQKGYTLASYISPNAFVSPSAKIGEHVFIFEDNTIQPFVTIGDGCVLWSGNHIGHHSTIGNWNFISSHVVISGHCEIGDNCFIGVNSTIANGTMVKHDSWVSHASVLQGTIPANSFVKSVASEIIPLNEDALNRALERARR